jgi:hypothetical protein
MRFKNQAVGNGESEIRGKMPVTAPPEKPERKQPVHIGTSQ